MALLGHWDHHCAYRYQAMIAGKKVKCRSEQVPNWEVEVGRGVPWFGGTELAYDDDRGVNIAGLVYECITDDVFGQGYPESLLLQDSFENVRTRTDALRISVLQADRVEFRTYLSTLFEYGDLWARVTGGLIELGQWEHGPIDVSSLPHVGPDDYVEEPDLTPTMFDEMVSKVTVVFCDREHNFKERPSEPYYNPNVFRIVGKPQEVVLRRPWITDAAIANRYAVEYGTMRCRPLISGSIKVRRDRARALGLRPGNLYVLDWASRNLSIVMRCIRRQWPAFNDQVATLTTENERGIWPSLYVPPPIPKPGNFIVETVAIAHQRIVELPSALRDKNALQVAVLAQRPSDSITGFTVHVSADDAVFDLVAPRNNFAAYGRVVNADYPAIGPVLDTTNGIQVEMFGVDNLITQTDSQREDRNLLLFVNGEIMSVGQVTPLGSGQYQVFVHRSLYGSAQAYHAIDSECFFIYRNQIVPIDNRNFAAGATVYFKLQPYTSTQEYDLALVSSVSHTFASGPFLLSGLELFGQGNDTTFVGRDPRFDWRMSTTGGIEISGSQLSLGAYDDQFAQFNLRVRDVDTGAVVWTGSTKVPEYVFDFEQNALCSGGPRRHFIFGVSAITRAIDGAPESTPWEEIEVSNPQTANPAGGDIGVDYNSFFGAFTKNNDLDFAGNRIWRSLDPAFEVDPAIDWQLGVDHDGVMLVWDSPSPNFSVPQPEASTYYYKSAPYDTFGKDTPEIGGLTQAITTGTLTPTLPPPAISEGSQSFVGSLNIYATPFAGDEIRYSFNGDVSLRDRIYPSSFIGGLVVDKSCVLRWRGYIGPDKIPTQQGIAIFTLVGDVSVGGGPGAPTCASVGARIASGSWGRTAITLELTCGTVGSSIQYRINGGSWTSYSTPVTLNLDDSIEFYASAGGYQDSPIDSYGNPTFGT